MLGPFERCLHDSRRQWIDSREMRLCRSAHLARPVGPDDSQAPLLETRGKSDRKGVKIWLAPNALKLERTAKDVLQIVELSTISMHSCRKFLRT